MNGPSVVNLVYLVMAVVVAIVAFRSSENFKAKNGVTPWHWPSWLWGFVGFISLLLCLILFVIASRATKPVTVGVGDGRHGDPDRPLRVPEYATVSRGGPSSPSTMSGDGAIPAPSGSWHGDPTGRFASRYWDGTRWTEHVSDGNTTTTDPL
jgi:hypothetical protein